MQSLMWCLILMCHWQQHYVYNYCVVLLHCDYAMAMDLQKSCCTEMYALIAAEAVCKAAATVCVILTGKALHLCIVP